MRHPRPVCQPLTSRTSVDPGRTAVRLGAALLAVGTLAFGAAGCGSSSTPATGGNSSAGGSGSGSAARSAGATAAPTSGATVSADAFAAAIAAPGTVLIDVRTPAEYASGHIQGARNLDMEAADFEAKLATLDKQATYALYCRSGNRSQSAMNTMRRLGFTHVFHLGGGVGAWTASSRTLVS